MEIQTKICNKCGFKGERSKFHGKVCNKCNNRKNLIKRYNKLGLPTPSIVRGTLIKNCKQCNFSGDKSLFHGRVCLNCNNDNIFVKSSRNDIKIRNKKYRQKKYNNGKNDILFKFRLQLSGSIRRQLKKNNGSKNNESILKYLPYSIEDLKNYLESLFEPWMTWENHGTYNRTIWDDNDSSTWTWHIDHIISQHKLPYVHMTDENFKRCWSLSNLRPLSAKINVIKGYR